MLGAANKNEVENYSLGGVEVFLQINGSEL